MSLLKRLRRVLTRRNEFKAHTGNLDDVLGASYDPRRTRISMADMDRPEGMGKRHVWPSPVPRSMQNQELDYDG